jgi:hypothetical protein
MMSGLIQPPLETFDANPVNYLAMTMIMSNAIITSITSWKVEIGYIGD